MNTVNKLAIVLALLLMSVAAGEANGQGRPGWFGAVEQAIGREEPLWKIGDGPVNDQGSSYTESFRLKKGALTGTVQITEYYILTNPEETFTGLVTAADNIYGGRKKKTKLDGIGAEAYMWAGNTANDFATVKFRKGKTFVTVFMPGKATAQRIAKHVAAQIP